MLLTVDVGNTNITWGIFSGDKLMHKWALGTDPRRSTEEYTELAGLCLQRRGIAPSEIKGVVMANVVPPMHIKLIEVCHNLLDAHPLVVGPGVKTRMKVRFDTPGDLGADRIANAVAAIRLYNRNAIVVDFGTATTFDCIVQGEYVGGAASPGLNTGVEGLTLRASRLPRVELTRPPTVVGKNVTTALQSGIVNGHGAMVDGMISRIIEEIGQGTVVLTGEYAEALSSSIRTRHTIDEALTLKGLRIIHEYTTTDA